jgi:hypothetical protein
MRKRIKFAKVSFVSLCRRGANRLPGLYKSEDDTLVFDCLAKMDEEGMLTSLVYVPGATDSDGHTADQATIEAMAHTFLENGAQLDTNHNLDPLGKDQAYVAESFIVQAGDTRFADIKDRAGQALDATGAWCIKTKLVDPELRKNYREDGWDGVSLYAAPGDYELEELPIQKAEDVAKKVTLRKQGKSDMDEDKIAALFNAAVAPLVARIDGLEKSLEKSDDTSSDDDSEEFTIPNPANKKAWKQYKKDLAKAEKESAAEAIADDFDLTTTEGCEQYEAALSKALGSDDDDKPEQHGGGDDPVSLFKAAMSGPSGSDHSSLIDDVLAKKGKLKKQYRKAGV